MRAFLLYIENETFMISDQDKPAIQPQSSSSSARKAEASAKGAKSAPQAGSPVPQKAKPKAKAKAKTRTELTPEEKEKNAKKIKITSTLGTILIILGILGILLPYFNSWLLGRNSDIDLTGISAAQMQAAQKTGEDVPFDEIKEVGFFDFWPLLGKWKTEDIAGELIIPSLDIDLAIFNDAENINLLAGVGQLLPDRPMGEGNYVLTGHHVQGKGTLLHNLMDAEIGAKIYITDKDKLYIYKVLETVQKDTDAIHMLDEERLDNYDDKDAIVSIMTCYRGQANSRWFVIAGLEEVTAYDPALIK